MKQQHANRLSNVNMLEESSRKLEDLRTNFSRTSCIFVDSFHFGPEVNISTPFVVMRIVPTIIQWEDLLVIQSSINKRVALRGRVFKPAAPRVSAHSAIHKITHNWGYTKASDRTLSRATGVLLANRCLYLL